MQLLKPLATDGVSSGGLGSLSIAGRLAARADRCLGMRHASDVEGCRPGRPAGRVSCRDCTLLWLPFVSANGRSTTYYAALSLPTKSSSNRAIKAPGRGRANANDFPHRRPDDLLDAVVRIERASNETVRAQIRKETGVSGRVSLTCS